MTWNFKSFTLCILLVSAFQVSAMSFVTTWPFPKLSKFSNDAQLDVQKWKCISVFDLHFYFEPTQMGTQFQSTRDSTLFLSWSHVKVQKLSKVHLIPGISLLNMGLLSHSHISIYYETIHLYRSTYVLPCSRAYGLFKGYSGILGKSSACKVQETFFLMLPHLKTFFWSVHHPSLENLEKFSCS